MGAASRREGRGGCGVASDAVGAASLREASLGLGGWVGGVGRRSDSVGGWVVWYLVESSTETSDSSSSSSS